MTYKPLKTAIRLEGARVIPEHPEHRKVSGTTFGAMLGHNPFISPFAATAKLMGIADEDENARMHAGKVIEPLIIARLKEVKTEWDVLAHDEIYPQNTGPHEEWKSDFDDPFFSGHCDGMIIDQAGHQCILEVKTAGQPWREVPRHYVDQVRLYSYFLCPNSDVAYIVMSVVSDDEVARPDTWDGAIEIYPIPIDRRSIEADMDEVIRFYNNTVTMGRTAKPDYANYPKDLALYSRYCAVASQPGEVEDMVKMYASLYHQGQEMDAARKDFDKRLDSLKEAIKTYMVESKLKELPVGPVKACIIEKTTKGYDRDQMIADGIDPDKYLTKTTSYALKLKASEGGKA